MELGEIHCLAHQVGIWAPRPSSRIESLIHVKWHQVWQVFHSSQHSMGTLRLIQEGFWCSSCLPHTVCREERTHTSFKVAYVAQIRPAKWQKTSTIVCTFKGKVELKKFSREQCDSISTAQWQELYELQQKAGLLKSKKTPESSKAKEGSIAALEVKTEMSGNESLFSDEKLNAKNRNNQALVRKGSGTRQSLTDT